MEILKSDAARKYLGRKFSCNLTQNGRIGLQHRVQLAWAKFNHFRSVLINKHVSIKLRFHVFDAVVTPVRLGNVTDDPNSTASFGCITTPDVEVHCWMGQSRGRGLAAYNVPHA